jgi:hypothetical protein
VYLFDGDTLDDHERAVARWAIEHPALFVTDPGPCECSAYPAPHRHKIDPALPLCVTRNG